MRLLTLLSVLKGLPFSAWHTPINWGVDRLVSVTDLNEQIKDNLDVLYGALPKRAVFFHDESTVTVGGALARTILGTQIYNHYMNQTGPANGDVFTQSVVLAPGTYTLYLMGVTTSSSGIVEWRLGGSLLGSHDWYTAGALVPNVLKTITSIVVSTGGRFVLEGKLNGKNALSSGYAFAFTMGWLAQASD